MTEKDKRILKYAIDNLVQERTAYVKDFVKIILSIEQNVSVTVI